MAGVGLLRRGTAHRLMVEFLLAEISKRPSSDRCDDREAYTLAAGLALGMVTLGKGSDGGAAGLADLQIEQRLHRAMVGGKERPDERSARDALERARAAAASGEQRAARASARASTSTPT